MKRSRFSDEQIIVILKEQEAGVVTSGVCYHYGISEAKFYKWKAKLGGLEASEAKRLRALEEENAKLKKLLAAQAVSPTWTCHGFMPLRFLVWAAKRSNARGFFTSNAECLLLGL